MSDNIDPITGARLDDKTQSANPQMATSAIPSEFSTKKNSSSGQVPETSSGSNQDVKKPDLGNQKLADQSAPMQSSPPQNQPPQNQPQQSTSQAPPQGPPQQQMPGRHIAQPEHTGGGMALILVLAAMLFLGVTLFMVVITSLEGDDNFIAQTFNKTGADLYIFIDTIVGIITGIVSTISFITFVIGAVLFGIAQKSHRPASGAKKTTIVSLITLLVFIGIYIGAHTLLKPGIDAGRVIKEHNIEILASETKGSAPFPVDFEYSELESEVESYIWDFGDNSDKARGHKARHVFTDLGDFVVTLTVIDAVGEKTEHTKRVIVENIKANVVIRANLKEGETPLEVQFDGSESKDPGGEPITKFVWDFGDLGSDERTAEGQKAIHTFYAPGEYDVTLTVTDSSGDESSEVVKIKVDPKSKKPKPVIITTPSELSGLSPFKVEFNATGSYDPEERTITEYAWDFGDRSDIEYGKRISHTFEKLGDYVVSLKITNDQGIHSTKEVEISVVPEQMAPIAVITPDSKLVGEAPYVFEVSAEDSSDPDGTIVEYQWDFGDKTDPKYGKRTSHKYLSTGEFTVRLLVTDNTDRKTEITQVVKVVEAGKKAPQVAIAVSPQSGVVPLHVEFDGTGSFDPDGQIIAYTWDFGDNSPVVQSSGKITHMYQETGIWEASLTVTDNDGLTSKEKTSISVNRVLPVAIIEASNTKAKAPATINFSAEKSTGFIQEVEWDFDDGNTYSRTTLDHTFYEPGLYNVKLTATDNAGVISIKTIQITIDE